MVHDFVKTEKPQELAVYPLIGLTVVTRVLVVFENVVTKLNREGTRVPVRIVVTEKNIVFITVDSHLSVPIVVHVKEPILQANRLTV